MEHWESTLVARDGLELFLQGWQGDLPPEGVVCLVHGLGEHSGRYGHLASFLSANRYALLASDLRGHGKSGGPKGHAPSYDILLDDIALLLREGAKRFGTLPCFLYGHSLGGNLVINYALRRSPHLAGIVATGPAFRTTTPPPPWKLFLARLLVNLSPALSMSNEIDPRGVSRDGSVVEAYIRDPMVHRQVTVRMGLDVLDAGLWALEHAAELSLPLLIMHGSDDLLTDVTGSREFSRIAGDRCTLRIWMGLYHEIHNEPQQKEVFAFLLSWLNSKNPHNG